jgi:hypothetical protein
MRMAIRSIDRGIMLENLALSRRNYLLGKCAKAG